MSEGAIRNVARFVADSLLVMAALRREAKASVPSDAETERRYKEFRRIYARAVQSGRVGDRATKAQTRRDLFEPMLSLLGFDVAALRSRDIDLDPGTALLAGFGDDETLLIDALPFANGADDRLASGEFRGSPHRRMVRALASGGARFGLILGGTAWRVVALDTANEPRYLEFDLDALADGHDLEAFAVFATIVSPDFVLGEKPFLAALQSASDALGTEVSDKLGPAARRALERLLEGVRVDARNAAWATGTFVEGPSLQQIHREGIYVLYRLLFVLFGESASPPALPLDKPLYRETYALERVRHDVAGSLEGYAENAHGLWESIKALFRLIDRGAHTKEFHVPAYNGGLFGRDRTPLLDRASLSDRACAEVLRELTTVEIGKGKHKALNQVSFRELGVAQLGAVFEGLLDYDPRIADQDLYEVAIGTGPQKGVSYVAVTEIEGDRALRPAKRYGEFYLDPWGGQRKATGAYYTPKAIADYLACETLGPHVLNKSSNEILEISVCDPAMGSGGFLVSATEFLGEAYYQAQVREGLCDVHDDRADQDRIRAKRLVAERCIYGVDMNPMAVELAKVSLWLTTLSYDRPLSFFDHHLRCGNTLFSAPLRDGDGNLTSAKLESIPAEAFKAARKESEAPDMLRLAQAGKRNAVQLSALDRGGGLNLFALDLSGPLHAYAEARKALSVDDLSQSSEDAVERNRSKERQLRDLTEGAESPFYRLREICDLWMSPWFWPASAEVDPPTTDDVRALTADIWCDGPTRGETLVEQRRIARTLRGRGQYFHWEIEFPEIFERGGFHAMLGNPPYTAAYSRESRKVEQAGSLRSIDYRLSRLSQGAIATSGRQNTFVYFTVLCEHLVREGGSVGLVLPDPLRTSKSYIPLRRAMTSTQDIRRLVAFRDVVFDSASVESCLAVFVHQRGQEVNMASLTDASALARDFEFQAVPAGALLETLDCRWIVPAHAPATRGLLLDHIAFVKDGINPGARAVRDRLFGTESISPNSRRFIEGRDISDFSIRWAGKWVEYDPSSITAEEKKAGTSLRERWIFTSPKIVYRQTAATLIAAVDMEGLFTSNSVHCIVLRESNEELLYALCAYLNSSLARGRYRAQFGEDRKLFPQVHISDVKRLPVPSWVIDPGAERERLAQLSREAHESESADPGVHGVIARIEEFAGLTEARLAAEPAEERI